MAHGLRIALAFLSISFTVRGANPPDMDRWMGKQAEVSLRYLLDNVSPKGTHPGVVIASPSRSNPDYFYHWVRDGALVMDVLVDAYRFSRTQRDKSFYFQKLRDFIIFSRKNQVTPSKGGIGEPKYNVDGSAYNGDWGRPQDDGPALRALTMTKLAFQWIQEGQTEMVRKTLYDSASPSNTLIKVDLEYVAKHWRNTCFDLWEEVRGHHFYTRLAQARALIEGAKLAQTLGDPHAATYYAQQSRLIAGELNRHWDQGRGYLVTTLNRDGGADYKHSNLDTSIILGILHAHRPDGFWSVTDEKVQATFVKIEEVFKKIYVVNTKGYPATVIGRYPEDRYDGNGNSQGNGWVLTTLGLGEFLHRNATEYKAKGRVDLTPLNRPFFESLGVKLPPGRGRASLGVRDPLFDEILKALKARGDAFMARAGFHGFKDGRFSEQINRNSGHMQGAHDLTWSYASFITAFWARSGRR